MNWSTADLATLSGGRGWRAAAILVVVHLVAGVVTAGLWAFGLLAIFDDLRWIPIAITATFGIVVTVYLFLRFGFWGTPSTFGRDGGEDPMETFRPGVGFGLGWLRWLLQLGLVSIVLISIVMTMMNVRWWHFVGTDELDSLPERAAAIPIPDDWTLVDTDASETGFPGFLDNAVSVDPAGHVEHTYEVPASYTFDDLKGWLASPAWEDDPDGDSFGAIRTEGCRSASTFCDVHLVPPAGEEPEFFVRAELEEPSFDGDATEVDVRLDHRRYVEPDWDVSDETIDRARAIPIPADWNRSSIRAEETINGEDFNQTFGVPESFTRDDLEVWLTGSSWTDPASGEPFGEIDVDPCREVGAGELDRTWLCSAIVVGTERSPLDEASDGPVESLTVSLTSDATVWVSLERNG